jgi:DNA polymerase sigma
MGRLSGFGAANRESVAELLVSFISYWARHHDYRQAVVSIRVGGALTKADKGW